MEYSKISQQWTVTNNKKVLDLTGSYAKIMLAYKQGIGAKMSNTDAVCPYTVKEPRLRQAWNDGYNYPPNLD